MNADKLNKLCLFVFLTAQFVCPSAQAGQADLTLVRTHEAQRVEMLAAAARSVVCIFPDRERSDGGSGVVIDPAGYGLTNYHVIMPMLKSRRGYGGLSDGRLYPLRVIGIDPGGDIALFKLEGKERFDYAPFGDSDKLRVGQWVAALGNPFLLAEDYVPTITLGVISGLHRYQYGQGNLLEYADCIQVSTSINPGNSGGPIVDSAGRVIAIAGRASFEERGRINVGLGYGVPINQIKRFLPALRAGLVCHHGTLGATVQLVGDDLIFNAIQPYSDAEQADIELGDVLMAIDGCLIQTPNEFNNLVTSQPAGWPVLLGLRRGEREFSVRVRLEPLPLRDMPLVIPDLMLNHAEIQRLFQLYEQHDRRAGEQEAGNVKWRVRYKNAAGVVQGGWPDETLREEWDRITQPLLACPELDVNWKVLGGDEVDGRIVSVVQGYLESGMYRRWKFDVDSHELLEITVGNEGEQESVVWRLGQRRQFDDMYWPAIWYRRASNGEQIEIVIEALEEQP